MHPKDRAQMMAYLVRPGKAKGGRIGFSYGSIPEALKKLIEDGDTNFENMPALKDKIEEMTGKRPGGSFQKGQTNYGPLLEKFTFEKFKTKKKYKPEEYVVEDQKKLTKKIEKLNKKYKLKNKGINVTQQVTATGKPILEIQVNTQVYGQVGRQAPPSIDGFNDIESELKKITKTDTFKNYDKSAAMKKGGEKAAAKMINPNKRPVFDYVLKNPNSTVDQITKALNLKKGIVTKTLQDLYADMYKRLGDQGAVYFKQFDAKDIISVADSIKDMDIDLKDRIKQLVTDAYKGDKNLKPLLKKISDFYAIQNKIKKTEYGKFFAGNLDHAVPLTFIRQLDEGADPINLIRVKPMPEYLNQRAFKSQFDRVLGQAYATKNKEALEAIVNLQSYLPKEFGGITPDGKIKDYGAKPFSLKTNLSQADFPEIYKRVFEFIKNPELQDTFKQSKVSFKKLLSQEKQIMKQADGYLKELEKLNAKGFTVNAKIPLIENIFNIAKSIPGDVAKKSYLKAAGKTLGLAFTPLMAYDTYKAFEQGKPVLEALEQGLIGTNVIGGTKDILALTPEERTARSVVKQDALKDLNLEMPMGFGFIEGPTPKTDMTLQEAQQKMEKGIQRVQSERAQKESNVAANRANFFGNIRDKVFGIGPDYQLEFANGGIAGLSGGIDKGPQRRSMNPDSQGLPGLLKRGRKG